VDRSEVARRGEDAAAAFLTRVGMDVLERNWRSAQGEVDIIARDGDALVFVEVKTRRSERAGTGEEAVSPTKQRRILKLADAYLRDCGLEERPEVRFDVVAIRVIAPDRALLRHHRAAFAVES
jgi:putative endonuclease